MSPQVEGDNPVWYFASFHISKMITKYCLVDLVANSQTGSQPPLGTISSVVPGDITWGFQGEQFNEYANQGQPSTDQNPVISIKQLPGVRQASLYNNVRNTYVHKWQSKLLYQKAKQLPVAIPYIATTSDDGIQIQYIEDYFKSPSALVRIDLRAVSTGTTLPQQYIPLSTFFVTYTVTARSRNLNGSFNKLTETQKDQLLLYVLNKKITLKEAMNYLTYGLLDANKQYIEKEIQQAKPSQEDEIEQE